MFKTQFDNDDVASLSFSHVYLDAIHPEQIDYIDSVTGSVDLSRVVGVYHPSYSGKAWGQLVPVHEEKYQGLKRGARRAKELAENPEYYLSNDKKDHWGFILLNGQYYISEGVHRTIIGRAFLELNNLPPVVHGVNICRYKDQESLEIIEPKELSLMEKWKQDPSTMIFAGAIGAIIGHWIA